MHKQLNLVIKKHELIVVGVILSFIRVGCVTKWFVRSSWLFGWKMASRVLNFRFFSKRPTHTRQTKFLLSLSPCHREVSWPDGLDITKARSPTERALSHLFFHTACRVVNICALVFLSVLIVFCAKFYISVSMKRVRVNFHQTCRL